MGTIAMMIGTDSASYAAGGGSTEAAHVSHTEAANRTSKSPTAVTAATMTASAATRLRVAGKQAAGHSGGHQDSHHMSLGYTNHHRLLLCMRRVRHRFGLMMVPLAPIEPHGGIWGRGAAGAFKILSPLARSCETFRHG
jgi:hypothetical protein